jgi:peroxiredoxin
MHRPLVLGAALIAGLLIVGCQPNAPETPKPSAPSAAQPAAPEPGAKPPKKHARGAEQPTEKVELPKPPEPKAIPKVSLSEEAQATNRVKVGDKLPGGELTDLAGKPQAIEKLLGPKVSVLFFWTAESRYSIAEVEDLQADVFQPMAAKGVQVVGINLDQDAKKARQAAEAAGAKFPILLDPGKKYFGKLATDKPMRTYLVDAQGVIRWFDLEYSRSTERDLLTGIEVLLNQSEAKPAKP